MTSQKSEFTMLCERYGVTPRIYTWYEQSVALQGSQDLMNAMSNFYKADKAMNLENDNQKMIEYGRLATQHYIDMAITQMFHIEAESIALIYARLYGGNETDRGRLAAEFDVAYTRAKVYYEHNLIMPMLLRIFCTLMQDEILRVAYNRGTLIMCAAGQWPVNE